MKKKRPDKREMRSYLVRVVETVEREYVVEAADEDDARTNYSRDDRLGPNVTEIDTRDWDVKEVTLNE